MKPFIIPIFIPHWGCPHQCIFCSQKQITGCAVPAKAEDVSQAIQTGLQRVTKPRHIEVAFYGGSFTALPLDKQAELLLPAYQALQAGQIHAIRLSTRPDSISSEVIHLLQSFSVTTVELGVQSFDDNVLLMAERGHSAKDSIQALSLLQAANFYTVAQLMVGLPGETWESILTTASCLIRACPNAIRIYPTLVLPDTGLANLYETGRYRPLSVCEATTKAAFLKIQAERHGISVIRIGLQATEDLNATGAVLAGPYHPSFGEMAVSRLFYLMGAQFFDEIACSIATFHHHPRDHSKLRGLANANLRQWRHQFGVSVTCVPDGHREGELVIECSGMCYTVNSSILYEV